jgi:hypothetical protein
VEAEISSTWRSAASWGTNRTSATAQRIMPAAAP